MIDGLPDDIEALIAAERASPDPSPAMMNAVRAHVARSVGSAPLGHAASGLAAKLIVLTLVIAAGALVYHLTHTGTVAEAATFAPSIATASELLGDDIEVSQPETRAPGAQDAATTISRTATALRAQARPDIARMLTSAWQMLSAGDASHALEVVQHVEALNASGPLEEERHALEIAALLALDRRDEARGSAQLFVERYPRSIHARLVRRALPAERSPQ